MTARAMLLSEKTIREIAELAASPTCYSIGAQFARTLYEAERNRLMDEIERLEQETFALEYSLSYEAGEYPDRKSWDKEHDQEADCAKCGHPYYRHFDSYENNRPVGCKYCDCRIFQEPIPLPEKHEEKGRE